MKPKRKQKDDKRETREHKGPLKIDLPFDEAMRRAIRVKPPEADTPVPKRRKRKAATRPKRKSG